MRLALADVVVLLDPPRVLCVLGIVRRRWRHRRLPRPDMAPGCPERLDLRFLLYVWSYPGRHRPRLLAAVGEHGKDHVLVRLRSRRAARAWLGSLSRRGA